MNSPPVETNSRGKPISSKEKIVELNVCKYLKSKHNDLTQQSLTALSTLATGISKQSVYRIITEKRIQANYKRLGNEGKGPWVNTNA